MSGAGVDEHQNNKQHSPVPTHFEELSIPKQHSTVLL